MSYFSLLPLTLVSVCSRDVGPVDHVDIVDPVVSVDLLDHSDPVDPVAPLAVTLSLSFCFYDQRRLSLTLYQQWPIDPGVIPYQPFY